jgi:hypothetical protein
MSQRYPEHKLLDSQWDAVYELVPEMGFDPNEFDREKFVGTYFGGVVPRLLHRPTDSQFVFDFVSGKRAHAVA